MTAELEDNPRYSIYPDCSEPGDPVAAELIDRWLEDAPPWRQSGPKPNTLTPAPGTGPDEPRCERGFNYVQTSIDERDAVNIALMLRRPLLVKGDPGLGKSSLAYSIAYRLGLGAPLRWEINSRTTLQDGLYNYDAVGHLHSKEQDDARISHHITLGPLGTAMSPHARPRVLLIDELDKSSYDLPNDLLHILEEARFRIPELRKDLRATIGTEDGDHEVSAPKGVVETYHHPVVIITSNGDREFPKPFLRRCVEVMSQGVV